MVALLKQVRDGLRPYFLVLQKIVREMARDVKEWLNEYETKRWAVIYAAIIWVLSGLQIIARPPIAGILYFGSLGVIVLVMRSIRTEDVWQVIFD